MDNKIRTMTDIEKNYIKLLFQEKINIFNKKYICNTDYVLNGLDMTQYKKIVALRSKMGRFYESMFAYLCGFTHNKVGFDLINYEKNIYIELKTNFNTDNYDSKNSKFQKLTEYKIKNPDHEVVYACLNDNRVNGSVDYFHTSGFRIITGFRAWEYFCSFSNINPIELIYFIRYLVRDIY